MKVTIIKLSEAENPVHPHNIEEGYSVTGTIKKLPVVGEQFYVWRPGGFFKTSQVQELLSVTSFRTHNSIYKIMDVFEEPQPQPKPEQEDELHESDVHRPSRIDTSKGQMQS